MTFDGRYQCSPAAGGMMDRKYSDPTIWDNSIDSDDKPDGSEGGYDRHGNYIIPAAMQEIVTLREALEHACKYVPELATVPGIKATLRRED